MADILATELLSSMTSSGISVVFCVLCIVLCCGAIALCFGTIALCCGAIALCCGTIVLLCMIGSDNLSLLFFKYQKVNTRKIVVIIGCTIQLTYEEYYDSCYHKSRNNRGYYERNVRIRH